MRILHLSTYNDFGGAGKAAHRLSQSLIQAGIESQVYSQFGNDMDSFSLFKAKAKRKLDLLPLKLYPHRSTLPFSPTIIPQDFNKIADKYEADIIHLHWINHGFSSIESLKNLNRPLVWTFHDSWAFTGGCHLPGECTRFQKGCGECPQLSSHKQRDLSSWIFKRKEKSWNQKKMEIVVPSQWMAEKTLSSVLFKDRTIHVISNPLNLSLFCPHNSEQARRQFKIPEEKFIVLTGAVEYTNDSNKGFDLFKEAFSKLKPSIRNLMHIITFGGDMREGFIENCPFTNVGHIKDERTLALLYSAADVFICSSRQENLPYTVLEALACGVPAIAFRTGGLTDLITHQSNGYLADCYSTDQLADGIKWFIDDEQRIKETKLRARSLVESKFSETETTEKYIKLYQSLPI